jgi:D-alanyl-D-alanine carboxypeptidase (penicillin-binding protein 5/6)
VEEPPIDAAGAILADLDTGLVLYEKSPGTARPIASLTKIMTALVVLRTTRLADVVTVDERAVFHVGDYGATSVLGLTPGERISVEDLLYALLLGSANDAAVALAIHVDGSERAFVDRMNETARSLGMRDTRFTSASGLDDKGRSTPSDLLKLVRVAQDRSTYAKIVATRFHEIPASRGPDRRIQNRNALLWLYPWATGGKTGYTAAAGYCLVATARHDGRRLVSIVLRSPDDAFSDAAALLNHGFGGFTQAVFVEAGEPQGDVRIRGGVVEGSAGSALTGLVPVEAVDEARTTIRVDPTAAFPPAPGERIGTIVVVVDGEVLGKVPLVSATPVGPATPGSDWWIGSGRAVAGALADALRGVRGD